MGYTKDSQDETKVLCIIRTFLLAVRTKLSELECLCFPEWGDSAPICVECVVIWSRFPCALELWNSAEIRGQQAESDEALERVLNGNSFSPVFVPPPQPYSLVFLSCSWCAALPTLLFKDM